MPIQRLTEARTPKWTGSMPSCNASGKRMGMMTMIAINTEVAAEPLQESLHGELAFSSGLAADSPVPGLYHHIESKESSHAFTRCCAPCFCSRCGWTRPKWRAYPKASTSISVVGPILCIGRCPSGWKSWRGSIRNSLAPTSSERAARERDLWVIEITNFETGPGDSKPAMWMDGNIHAGEVTGRQLMMYFVEAVLESYGKDSIVTRLVDTRTFYVMPIFDADGGESRLTQHPAWPEHKPEEHRGKDLDGDGYVTQMRVKDPEASRIRAQSTLASCSGSGIAPAVDGASSRRRWRSRKRFEEDFALGDRRYRVYREGPASSAR